MKFDLHSLKVKMGILEIQYSKGAARGGGHGAMPPPPFDPQVLIK